MKKRIRGLDVEGGVSAVDAKAGRVLQMILEIGITLLTDLERGRGPRLGWSHTYAIVQLKARLKSRLEDRQRR